MSQQPTTQQLTELQNLVDEIKNNPSAAASTPSFSQLWPFLQASETQLTQLMSTPPVLPPSTANGEPELGLMLYQLNSLKGSTTNWYDKYVYDILWALSMPSSTITTAMYNSYENRLNTQPGIVAGDGTYMSTATYGSFDDGWHEAAYNYILLLFGEILSTETGYIGKVVRFLEELKIIPTIQPFVTSPKPLLPTPQGNSLSIAVFGDWGTGAAPAAQLLNAIKRLNPNIYMHLGDVYYSGTTAEENSKLLAPLKNVSGTLLTLNSNHEMYVGGDGYFNTALKNSLFTAQQGASYFAIEFKNWVLLGLDSAYFDMQTTSNLDAYLNGALYDATNPTPNPQVAFVKSLHLTGKKVVVFTHHNGISLDGISQNQPLLSQLYTVLGNKYPDFWYYGHIHDGVVYTNPPALAGLKTPSNNTPQLRCTGNAALPYGVPYWLKNPAITGIPYFAQTNAQNKNIQLSKTIRNGFAMVTLSQNTIVETFYEVDVNTGAAIVMWNKTTNF